MRATPIVSERRIRPSHLRETRQTAIGLFVDLEASWQPSAPGLCQQLQTVVSTRHQRGARGHRAGAPRRGSVEVREKRPDDRSRSHQSGDPSDPTSRATPLSHNRYLPSLVMIGSKPRRAKGHTGSRSNASLLPACDPQWVSTSANLTSLLYYAPTKWAPSDPPWGARRPSSTAFGSLARCLPFSKWAPNNCSGRESHLKLDPQWVDTSPWLEPPKLGALCPTVGAPRSSLEVAPLWVPQNDNLLNLRNLPHRKLGAQ